MLQWLIVFANNVFTYRISSINLRVLDIVFERPDARPIIILSYTKRYHHKPPFSRTQTQIDGYKRSMYAYIITYALS